MSHPFRMATAVLASLMMLADTAASAQSADKGPLQLESKILLGDIRGRIDHMAVDLKRLRLFVAELGNDSVGVVDLANRSLIRTITGLNEPQGVGYESSTDALYVANARDGSVRLFEGNEYKDDSNSAAMPTMSASTPQPSVSSLVMVVAGWRCSILRPAARSRTCR